MSSDAGKSALLPIGEAATALEFPLGAFSIPDKLYL